MPENRFTIPPENVRREIEKYAANPRLAIGPLISALFTYRNIGGDLAAIEPDAKELLLPRINKPVTKRNFYTVYRDLTQLAHLFNWDELRDIKIRMIPLFISELNRYEEKEGFQDTASFAEYVITMLKDKPNVVDLAQDQVADAINNMKPKIMKDLLTLFKHGNAGPATSIIHHYRLIGVNWPEFVAIEKSLAANKKPKPLAEAASLETLLKYADDNIGNMEPSDVGSFYEVILGLETLAKGKAKTTPDALIAQVLFKHKSAILKQIDSLINDSREEIATNGIFAIGLLKRLGINWPELQQLAERRIPEVANTALANFSTKTALSIIDSVKQLGIPNNKIKLGIVAAGKKLLADIEKMIDENPVNYYAENKFRLFSRLGINYKIKDGAVKTKLLNGLDKYLAEQGLTPGTVSIIEILTKYSADPAKTLSEIAALMNKHKTSIVKRLLQDFKNDNTYNLKDYLITLKSLKLNWPELDIIIRSIGSSKNLYESLDASTAISAMSLLYRMIGVKYKVPHSWERKEYEQFIDEHKTQIIEFLQQHAKTWGGEDITPVSSGLFMIMWLQFNGIDWPEIRDLLEQHKHDVIKMLLSTIKYEGGLLRYSKDIFTTLVAMGFNWPELEIVKRSANSLSRRS